MLQMDATRQRYSGVHSVVIDDPHFLVDLRIAAFVEAGVDPLHRTVNLLQLVVRIVQRGASVVVAVLCACTIL